MPLPSRGLLLWFLCLGTACKFFGEFSEVSGFRRDGFEFYSRARFIRVTGDVFRGMCGGAGVVPLNVPQNGR